MTDEAAIAEARREIDRLEFLLQLLGKQVDNVAEVMKNQGLARRDGIVDPELVRQHERLTETTDNVLDRIVELQRQILTSSKG
jgi:hypothetical protein